MITLTQLRIQIRHTITSITEWPNDALTTWIQDAIRDYSSHFPFIWKNELSLTTGTQTYNLPNDNPITAVLSIQYPASQSPPAYLIKVTNQQFQPGRTVFTLIGINDQTTPTATAQIKFGPAVHTGETALITYAGQHQIPNQDTDLITVPEYHLNLITTYITWKAAERQQFDELENPFGASLLEQLKETAATKQNQYHTAIKEAKTAVSSQSQSAIVSWEQEQIY